MADPQDRTPRSQLANDLLPFWRAYGPIVDVTFPVANTDRDVAHGLRERPSGFLVLYADTAIYARPGPEWATKELAWLRSPVDNAHARVLFFTFRGDANET